MTAISFLKLLYCRHPYSFFSYDRHWLQAATEVVRRAGTYVATSGAPPSGGITHNTDVLIVGGGAIGMSTAFWLKQILGTNCSVTVVERDFTYSRASTTLSVGGIRQQFSLSENIKMSRFSVDFLRNAKHHLSVLGVDPPNVHFREHGYLFLASPEGAHVLEENFHIQTTEGAHVELLTETKLKERFPWMRTDGVALASFGLSNEGWFDPWLLLFAFKVKAASLGVHFVSGNVIGFQSSSTSGERLLDEVLIASLAADSPARTIRFARCVICAGPWSGNVAQLAHIGSTSGKDGPLSINVPVEPRKRYVYMFHCPSGPTHTPMVIDSSGVYVRREGRGGHYICGSSPPVGMPEPDATSLDVDYEFFHNHIWPILAQRVPEFESLKLKSAWAGYYDYNYFDQNLIIGCHPARPNFYLATGCSGHGIQHSPAIGLAMAELLALGHYETIDLSRLSFDRVIHGVPLREQKIV